MTRKCNNNRTNFLNFKNMNFSSPKSILVSQTQDNENSGFTPVSSRCANKLHIKIADPNVIKIKQTHMPKKSTKICIKFLNETCYDRQKTTASENSIAFFSSNVEKKTKFMQPTIKRCVETRQHSSIELNSKFCQQVEPKLEIIRRIVSTKRRLLVKETSKAEENKHGRYVPSILKNPNKSKSTRNPRNRTINGSSVNEHDNHMETTCILTRDQNSSKRKRKQVLQPLIQKYDCSNSTIDKKPNADNALQEKQLSELETEQADDDDSSKTGEPFEVANSPEETEVEQTITETKVSHSTSPIEPCAAQSEVERLQPVEISSTCNYKSIKKIIDEFQVPDYKNYVNCEDLCVDTDDMNKLLSNVDDNEILPIPFYPTHSISEYDCNGNDIGKDKINFAEIEQNPKLQRSSDFHFSSKLTMNTEVMDFLGFDKECPESVNQKINSSGIVCDWQSSDDSPSFCSISDSDFQNSDSAELLDAAETTDTSFINEIIDCSGNFPVVNNDVLENIFDQEINKRAFSEIDILQDAEKLLNDKVMNWYFQMDPTDIKHPIIGMEQIYYYDSSSIKKVTGDSSQEHNVVEAFDNVLNVNSDGNNNSIVDDDTSGNGDDAILSKTRYIESFSETQTSDDNRLIIVNDDPNFWMTELFENKSEMNLTQHESSHDTSTDSEFSVNRSLSLLELHELLDTEHCGVEYISDVQNENELKVAEVVEAIDSENEIHHTQQHSEEPDEVSATSGISLSLKKQTNENYTAQKIQTNFDSDIRTIEKNPEEEQDTPELRPCKHIKNEQNVTKLRRQRTADSWMKDPRFRCEICDKTYRHKGSLNFHYKKVHSLQNTPSTESDAGKDHKCEMCSKSYALPGALKSHMNLHYSFRLTCFACGKHFARIDLLKSHASYCYNIRNLQCIYCGKKFNKQHKLSSHLRVHYDELKDDGVDRKES